MTFCSSARALIVIFATCTALYTQRELGEAKLAIVNGRAIELPRPEYPQKLKDLCADGKVEIEVSINEEGNVTKATALSGDYLLFTWAVHAVRKATFQKMPSFPVKTRGIVVYNFINDVRCFDAGIVNEKARVLPKPVIPRVKFSQPQTIKIRVIIDAGSGKVILSKAENAKGSITRQVEAAARGARFYPTNDVGNIRIKGFIIYKISASGKVTT